MKKWNADRIVSVSAIVVSVATLMMIFYQTNLMREEQRASVMPSVRIGYSMNDTLIVNDNDSMELENEKIWLENNGLGPAFIDKISIRDSTGTYDTDLFGYFKKVNSNKNINVIKRVYPGTIIPKNEKLLIYDVNSNLDSSFVLFTYFEFPFTYREKNDDDLKKPIIEVYYKSVYDDHWKISSDKTIPKKIE